MQEKAGRFFKESEHPSLHNHRFELLQRPADESTEIKHYGKIFLDFSSLYIKCYYRYQSDETQPLIDKDTTIFSLTLTSNRDIDRTLNSVIFSDSFQINVLDALAENQTAGITGLLNEAISYFHQGGAAIQQDPDEPNNYSLLFLYFFYEDFENSKLFKNYPDYREVHAALHSSSVFRAFIYKLRFLQYHQNLVANKTGVTLSKLYDREKRIDGTAVKNSFLEILKRAKIRVGTFLWFDNLTPAKKNIPNNELNLGALNTEYLGVTKEWANIICADDYIDILPVSELKKRHKFFETPEKELVAVTRSMRAVTNKMDQVNIEGDPRIKKLRDEILIVENKAVKFLLRRYDVLDSLIINTNNNKLAVFFAVISLVFPLLFTLGMLIHQAITPLLIFLFWSGFVCLIITAWLIFKELWIKAPNQAMASFVKLMFPRLLIAIISGWIIFTTTTEFLTSEFKKEFTEILMGLVVVVVTWLFMLNEVKSIAPYYDPSRRLKPTDESIFSPLKSWFRSFWNLGRPNTTKQMGKVERTINHIYPYMASRVTLVVCAAFMLSFYIGAAFHVFFISDILQQNGVILNKFDEFEGGQSSAKKIDEINAHITNSINLLNQQLNLSNEHAIWVFSNSVRSINHKGESNFQIDQQRDTNFRVHEHRLRMKVNGNLNFTNSFNNMGQALRDSDEGKFLGFVTDKLTNMDTAVHYLHKILILEEDSTDDRFTALNDSIGRIQIGIDSLKAILAKSATQPKESYRDIAFSIDAFNRSTIVCLLSSSAQLLAEKAETEKDISLLQRQMSEYTFFNSDHYLTCPHLRSLHKRVFDEINTKKLILRIGKVFGKNRVIFPRMLVYQALFAMFFGIFSQLVLQDKSITESL